MTVIVQDLVTATNSLVDQNLTAGICCYCVNTALDEAVLVPEGFCQGCVLCGSAVVFSVAAAAP